MQGHHARLAAYGSLNAQVVGVSRDDIKSLQYWKKHLRLSFPLLSNISGYLGSFYGIVKEGSFPFERRTVVIDKKATIRYVEDGSPDYDEILKVLKQLDGTYLLKFPYSREPELVMDILKHGADVEVLAPESLRKAVAEQLRQASTLYAK